MKRSDWVIWFIGAAILGLVLIVCTGCKTATSSENHMAASAAETLEATGHSETHVEEAPSKTTTTVEEFRQDAENGTGHPPHSVQGSVAPAAPTTGPLLVRRTVTVEERGPISTSTVVDAKSQEREDSTLSSESESKRSFDFLHGPLVWIGFVVVAGGALAFVLKLKGIL